MICVAVFVNLGSTMLECASRSRRPCPLHLKYIAACTNGGVLISKDNQEGWKSSSPLLSSTSLEFARAWAHCKFRRCRYPKTTSLPLWVMIISTPDKSATGLLLVRWGIYPRCRGLWRTFPRKEQNKAALLNISELRTNAGITMSYEHRYDSLYVHCLFGSGVQIMEISCLNRFAPVSV